VRFIDGANFDPSFISDLAKEGELLSYNASFGRQWCGDPVSETVQCGPAESFEAARSVPADGAVQTLDAVLGPAGRIRVDISDVPETINVGRMYVQDVTTGRWFNTYVQPPVAPSTTWSFNAPALIPGREYRASVGFATLEDNVISNAQQWFVGGANLDLALRITAQPNTEEVTIVEESWRRPPFVVYLAAPNGLPAITDPDQVDGCLALFRKDDSEPVASACVSTNGLDGFPSVLELQSVPDGEYRAVVWRQKADTGEVMSLRELNLPDPLEAIPFFIQGYSQGLFDLTGLTVEPESLVASVGEFSIPIRNLTVVLP
jgi:hypothetical protein